jgi:hypothetical protein
MEQDFSKQEIRQLIHEEIGRTQPPRQHDDHLDTRKEAALYLGIKENTLAVWAMKGHGPAPTKIGRRSMYRRTVLEQFIKDNTMPR